MNVGVSILISFKHSLGGNLKKNVLIASPNLRVSPKPSDRAGRPRDRQHRRHQSTRVHAIGRPAAAARLTLGRLGAVRSLRHGAGLFIVVTLA